MWTAYLFQTASGVIGPRVDVISQSWSIGLNEVEKLSIKLSKSDLPKLNLKYWLDPWWAGVVLCWNDFPIVAGPIVTSPTETMSTINLDCAGIRAVLDRRHVINEQTNWSVLASKKVSYKNLTLGTIAKKVVQLSMQKPGGYLPISFPHADKAGKHERNYMSFNLSNIGTHEILTKLSEVINGPDIMFRPRLLNDAKLTFDMYYGDDINPRIDQVYSPVWDSTAEHSPIVDLSMGRSGADVAYRVFAIGAGQDEGTLIRMAETEKMTALGYPLLEASVSFSSVETPSVLQAHAEGVLQENVNELIEISGTIRVDENNPLNTLFVGDSVRLIVKDWVTVPNGNHKARIVSMSGDASDNIKVALQIED